MKFSAGEFNKKIKRKSYIGRPVVSYKKQKKI
jgi:hypothetical protein